MTDRFTAENWRKLAGTRQGVINKLDKKVRRLEAEVTALNVALDSASKRLALYDARHRV